MSRTRFVLKHFAGPLKGLLVPALVLSVLLSAPQAFSQKILTTIKIGGITGVPAINTATNMIYVPNSTTGTVAVIDGRTNKTVTNIPVGTSPFSTVVNPNTNLVYVGGFGTSGYIAVIDGSSNTVTYTVSVYAPGYMAVNTATNLIYFANGGGVVSVLDGATNQVIDTITIVSGGCCIQGLAVDAVTNRIYVSQDDTNTVTVIDGKTDKTVTWTIPNVCFIGPIGVDKMAKRVYVLDDVCGEIYVLNVGSGSLVTEFSDFFIPMTVNQASHLVVALELPNLTSFLAFFNDRNYQPVGGTVSFPPSTTPYFIAAGVSNRYYVTFYQQDGIAVVSGP